MRDYVELVTALRCCSTIDALNNGCDSCPYEYCGEDCQNLCGYAADAIEELLAAVLDLEEQIGRLQDTVSYRDIQIKKLVSEKTVPHWISVEERLPETDDWVIVAILDDRGDTPYQYADFGWYLDAARCWIINAEQRRDVTHWMPLPAPPKEVEKK